MDNYFWLRSGPRMSWTIVPGRDLRPWMPRCLWTIALVEALRRMDTLSIVASRRLRASGNTIPIWYFVSSSSAWTASTSCTCQVTRGSRARNCSRGDIRHGLITGRSLTLITPLSMKRTLSSLHQACDSRTWSWIWLRVESCHGFIVWRSLVAD